MIQVNRSKFYTVGEVAEMLKVSKGTVSKLIRLRKLRSTKVGRARYIDVDAIEELLK